MNTKEMIEVMQAYVDGKEIEFKPIGGDIDVWITDVPMWNWNSCKYRVKQKPQRTHKEIMSNWFLIPGHGWRKVSILYSEDRHPYWLGAKCYAKEAFNDFKMK